MNYLYLVSSKAPNRVFISVFLGVISGGLFSLMIPLVLASIENTDHSSFGSLERYRFWGFEVADHRFAALFFSICAGILITRSLSEILLAHVASELIKDLRQVYYRQISNSSIAALEKIGTSPLIASINVDVPQLVEGARALPGILVNSATIIGMLCYLFYLSPEILEVVLLIVLGGTVFYQLAMTMGAKLFRQSRSSRDNLQKAIDGLILGAKELKSSVSKRNYYLATVLHPLEDFILKKDKQAQTLMQVTINFAGLLCFFAIGFITFVEINYVPIGSGELIGIAMVLLYITGPIEVILSSIPILVMASVSNKKFNQLVAELPSECIGSDLVLVPKWSAISFQEILYEYDTMYAEKNFIVGPLNLRFKRRQVTFIVGPNGSGKSTLSKIIAMHYTATSGNIFFDDLKIDMQMLASYRAEIGVIHSDFYLFEQLLFPYCDEKARKAERYLKMLELHDKVRIADGRFSTLSLSDGQRKRLALLVALLEDRSVYLFDEWASDQDPRFRKIFYTEILKELKERNKVVIVVSHDDAYFEYADQLVRMEHGQIRSITDAIH